MTAVYYTKPVRFILPLPLSLQACLDCDCERHEHLVCIHVHLVCKAVPTTVELQSQTRISRWHRNTDKIMHRDVCCSSLVSSVSINKMLCDIPENKYHIPMGLSDCSQRHCRVGSEEMPTREMIQL